MIKAERSKDYSAKRGKWYVRTKEDGKYLMISDDPKALEIHCVFSLNTKDLPDLVDCLVAIQNRGNE